MNAMQKTPRRYPLALLALMLNGCAWIPQHRWCRARRPPNRSWPVPVVNGSIYQTAQPINYGYQPLFEDRRPRNVGDTLTIVLQENVSASKSSSANASRDGKSILASIPPRYLQGCSAMRVQM
jgi:flagellar L-ring protein precursor FlgH